MLSCYDILICNEKMIPMLSAIHRLVQFSYVDEWRVKPRRDEIQAMLNVISEVTQMLNIVYNYSIFGRIVQLYVQTAYSQRVPGVILHNPSE